MDTWRRRLHTLHGVRMELHYPLAVVFSAKDGRNPDWLHPQQRNQREWRGQSSQPIHRRDSNLSLGERNAKLACDVLDIHSYLALALRGWPISRKGHDTWNGRGRKWGAGE